MAWGRSTTGGGWQRERNTASRTRPKVRTHGTRKNTSSRPNTRWRNAGRGGGGGGGGTGSATTTEPTTGGTGTGVGELNAWLGPGRKVKKSPYEGDGVAGNNTDFDNALGDEDPLAGWNSYWKGFGLGSAADNTAFMGSSFQPWFQDTYFNEMRNRWKAEQILAPTADGAGHWLDWLKNSSNLNPQMMRNSWASQSDLTRGLPGRAQSRWMAV
jgi:hypothetical protein